jgi:hypothetical protein
MDMGGKIMASKIQMPNILGNIMQGRQARAFWQQQKQQVEDRNYLSQQRKMEAEDRAQKDFETVFSHMDPANVDPEDMQAAGRWYLSRNPEDTDAAAEMERLKTSTPEELSMYVQQVHNDLGIKPREAKQIEPYTLSPGASRYNAQNQLVATAPGKPAGEESKTSDMKNYELAKQEGFDGNFMDYRKEQKQRTMFDEGATLTQRDETLAQMLANNEIDVSQLPKRGTSFNKIIAAAKILNPDFNARTRTADFNLSKNAAYRQKAMTAEVLPDIMNEIVNAGKEVDFSNVRSVGSFQKFYKEQMNDPKLVEYMALRNDGLMEIAGVMRSAGMTDKAHQAEEEAMNPTMSPRALDAWATAQTKALRVRLSLNRKVISGKTDTLGEKGSAPITIDSAKSASLQDLEAQLEAL